VKRFIVKKKKERVAASGFLRIYRHVVHSEVFGLGCFGSEQIEKIKNSNKYTLTPENPNNGGVFARIILVLINEKEI
jgi:hypothetical protein